MFCVGCYLKVSRSDYTELLDSKEFQTGTALCISAGIIVVVVGLLGFFGLAQENQFLLALVSVCMCVDPFDSWDFDSLSLKILPGASSI